MELPRPQRLRHACEAFEILVRAGHEEQTVLRLGRQRLAELVMHDDWLPDAYAQPDSSRYRQYLLYLDPEERFSVVSFVWGPGQFTPVHDHTVWGLVGVLRGAELSQLYRRDTRGKIIAHGTVKRLEPGEVEAVSPRIGDIHSVQNAYQDRVSISIHVYGANIGNVRRHVFHDSGSIDEFVSGYNNVLDQI